MRILIPIVAIVGVGLARADTPVPVTETAHAGTTALDALLARTEAVAKEVAKLRGLPLKKPVPNDVVDKAELRVRLEKAAQDDKAKASTVAEGFALMRWGMVPLDTDYAAMVIGVLNDQIAGYYDTETKKMTIVSSSVASDPKWAEMVLAHELDHALQDQSFDLKKFESLPDSDGDAALARHALVEGDGIALMIEVMVSRTKVPLPWSNPQVSEMIQKEMATPSNGDSLDHAPLAIREAMLFPYRAGFGFIAALRHHQPWSAVDAAFVRPPRSTEQILHPERYLADDLPIPVDITVPASLAGFTIAHSTVWGEFGVDVFLRSHDVGAPVAAEASAGWGGDRAVVLVRDGSTKPERAVGIMRSEWDSEADAVEAAEALTQALDATAIGGTIEHTQTRTSWLGLDGTVAWVERRGPGVVTVIGAPAWAATALGSEVWTASSVKPASKKRP